MKEKYDMLIAIKWDVMANEDAPEWDNRWMVHQYFMRAFQ
jgi:hypothetical protein